MAVVRRATTFDVPPMAAIRSGDPEVGPADPRMEAYLEGVHHPRGAREPRAAFLADVDGAVVGYIAGHLTERFDCDGEVQYLYVAALFRRAGIATALLRHLAAWFVENGADSVCVDVDAFIRASVPRGSDPIGWRGKTSGACS